MYEHRSDIARFKQQLGLQEQGAQQGLQGLTIVGGHQYIEACMEIQAASINPRLHHLLAQEKEQATKELITSSSLWD